MRRLSIIDVAEGHQPLANEDDTVHTVYNGEIYNYRQLRDELSRRGHRFKTRCDTETIVHAYEDAGDEFLLRLRGMFALAVWDERRRRLLLAVDRFGIKPLYFASSPTGLVFGSELKCILESGLVKRELDHDALAQYFTFGYIPAPRTIFQDVRKLGPGQLLTWTAASGATVATYWDVPASAEFGENRDTTLQVVRESLREAVRAHLVSDVPLGAFLSGGIDSSCVVALMSEVSPEPVKTFSIGFADPRYNELGMARLVAQRFRTDHHELIIEPSDVSLLPEIVGHFDEPFADASALPTYHVSKLARESVKVALSGDGGDELFLGYTIFRGLELARRLQHLPLRLRHGLAALPSLVPPTPVPSWNDRRNRLQRQFNDTLAPPSEAFRRKIAAPGLRAIAPYLSTDLRALLLAREPYRVFDGGFAPFSAENGGHPLEDYIRAGLRVSLPGDMLVKVDRMSMANSLEVRVPFLDHVLVDVIAAIPVAERFRGWRLKGLLKDAMADVLPREVLHQPKRGFNVPLAAWFRGDVSAFAFETLTSSPARQDDLINVDAVRGLLTEHARGRENLGSVIWSLLMFGLWCDRYFPR